MRGKESRGGGKKENKSNWEEMNGKKGAATRDKNREKDAEDYRMREKKNWRKIEQK